MKNTVKKFIIALVLAALAAPAMAQEYITVGAGYYNVFDDDDNATVIEAEYRAPYVWDKFQPVVGGFFNSDSGRYIYAGITYDWNIAGGFYMIPGFAIGAYGKGDSKDLGGALEFRSSIAADYQFDNGWRAGVTLYHLSNAHTYDKNPGTEIVSGRISFPFSVFGR